MGVVYKVYAETGVEESAKRIVGSLEGIERNMQKLSDYLAEMEKERAQTYGAGDLRHSARRPTADKEI